ncbi:MAG: AfsR/SARP family transcriptional regulator, partial [Acidimicrobiales bacterium]
MVEGRTIHLLGAVRAVQGDSEHPLAGVQARRVLVFLALEQGRPVSNDELAQVLWPDGPGRHWEGAL